MNHQELSIIQLVLQASVVVQAVMLLLLLASVANWAAILRKFKTLRDIRQQNSRFEDDFWSGSSLNDLYDRASHNPIEGIRI